MPSKKPQPSIRDGIYNLLGSVEVMTKEQGRAHIEPWPSQRIIIDQVTKGLAEGVHEFAILKCRQVAATTTCSILTLFWCLVNSGVQAATIADRTDNLERLRRIFAAFLESLPPDWRGPEHELVVNNRNMLRFANDSVIDLLAAGTNPDLGASRALNFLHATECGQWRSLAGVESLRASLARENPHRCYLFESIANGFNWWYHYCMEARADRHKRFIFLGFWSNPTYQIPKSDPDYRTFMEPNKKGEFKLMDTERDWARQVYQQYDYVVKPEQIAWWRREGEFRQEEYMWRHYPWHEQQCFVASGSGFFPAKRSLAVATALAGAAIPFKAYKYTFDENFLHSRIEQVTDPKAANLRVWEPPQPGGVYVIGVDPSGGGGGEADDHAIEVFRCYADRLVQVAEYQSNYPLTYQLAWVMCHLAGCYRDHVCNLEVTGIGAAVIPETRNLRLLAERGFLQSIPGEPILDVIGVVKWYLYERVDSLSGPTNMIAWKTNQDNKAQMYDAVRNSFMRNNELELRSSRLVQQMQSIVQDDGWIGAGEDTGENDDLVSALVLAHHPWVTRVQRQMMARGETWARVNEPPITDRPDLVMSYAVSKFMTGIWVNSQTPREKF